MVRLIYAGIALVIGLWLCTAMFIVDQRQYAVVFAFGEVKQVIDKPGLHFKLPWMIQSVRMFENRIMTIESSDADRFITAEKKNILVDAFVKWRIIAPKTYYVSVGDSEARAVDRMSQIVKAALNDEITKRTVREVISGERGKVMDAIRAKVSAEAKTIGVDIIDVRLRRVDYVEQINNSVYDRMRAERAKVANLARSDGSAESERIRANANKQRTTILAEAYRDAEKIRGEGDANATRIYSEAFGQNPEFYKFYRSLEAYRASFKNHSDVMVVDSNSEFFKYMKAPTGNAAPAPAGKK
jgi:membrane protease subunit HflC